jgi:hypothetical protein
MKGIAALLALTCIVTLPLVSPAWSAPPSAENARTCRDRAIRTYPTQLAGSAQGSAQAQRTYFRKCMAQLQSKASKPDPPKNK